MITTTLKNSSDTDKIEYLSLFILDFFYNSIRLIFLSKSVISYCSSILKFYSFAFKKKYIISGSYKNSLFQNLNDSIMKKVELQKRNLFVEKGTIWMFCMFFLSTRTSSIIKSEFL